jgi:predicted alpha/beta-fold hydrolase
MRELAERDGLDRFAVLGYSLGGNIALKLAGELESDEATRVVAVAAVSPPIELGQCVDALERLSNVPYHLNFLRGLRGRLRRKGALFPQQYDLSRLARVRSVRAFDDAFTAPHNGFDGAADYYHRASAMRVLHRLAVPGLILTAADDPFVPPEAACDPALAGIGRLTRVVTRHGGHCGFVGRPGGADDDGYWAERQVVDFVAAHAAGHPRASNSSIR